MRRRYVRFCWWVVPSLFSFGKLSPSVSFADSSQLSTFGSHGLSLKMPAAFPKVKAHRQREPLGLCVGVTFGRMWASARRRTKKTPDKNRAF